MRQTMPPVEQPNFVERVAHRGRVTVGLYAGAVMAHEVWRFKHQDESLADYALSRAKDVWSRARPLASKAIDYVRGKVADLWADPVANPGESPLEAVSNDAAVNAPKHPLETPKTAKVVKPEAEPVEYDLQAIFANGESFAAAYDDRKLPWEVQKTMRELVLARRLVQAVPQAAELWSSYVEPALRESDLDLRNVVNAAYELTQKAQQLQNWVTAAHNNLTYTGRDSDPGTNQQAALAAYQGHVRLVPGSYNERALFEDAAVSYGSLSQKVDLDKAVNLVDLSNAGISDLASQLVSSSNADYVGQYEAQEIIDKVRPQLEGELTLDKIKAATAVLEQEARADESERAFMQRVRMVSFFGYRLQISKERAAGARASSGLMIDLLALDQWLNGHTIQHPDAAGKLAGISEYLSGVQMSLKRDIDDIGYRDGYNRQFSELL